MELPSSNLRLEQFIDWENEQVDRHELYHGEIFAMVGVRRVHGVVGLNIAMRLKQQLNGSACGVFVESLKLKVNENIFYPDVFVTCDKADLQTEVIFTSPTVIVEVLSQSTQAFDRGLKFAAYRQILSLKEYLLVDPDTRVVELYRRGSDGLFTLHDYTEQPTCELVSIGCVLSTTDIFDGLAPSSISDTADAA